MLTEYTTYEEIRAVLGVADEELEDAVLAQPLFERQLILDLDDINTGLVDQFKTISAIDYATRSTAQKRFFDLVQLYSAYAIGKSLLTSLPYFAELRMQDGRGHKERVKDPFQLTQAGVLAGCESLRLKLSAAFVALFGGDTVTRTIRTMVVGVGIAKDPVTNV